MKNVTKMLRASIGLLLCCLIGVGTTLSAQPANDNVCGAIALTVDGTCATQFSSVGATAETGEVVGSCFSGGTTASVWFSFVGPTSGMVRVTTDIAGATFTDTEIAIYSISSSFDPCAPDFTALTEVGCDQDGGTVVNYNSIVDASGLTVGDTYYVQVDQWNSATLGDFCIEVDDLTGCTNPLAVNYEPTALADDGSCTFGNDDICGAIGLTVDATCSGQFSSVGATAETGEVVGSCFSGGATASVWFSFVAPPSGTVQATTDIAGATFTDTEIAIYSASSSFDPCAPDFTALTELGCDQDGGTVVNYNSIVDVSGLTAGTTYYVQVDQWNSATLGEFCIEVLNLGVLGCTNPAASNFDPLASTDDGSCMFNNDDVCDAVPLTMNATCISQFSTVGATAETGEVVGSCFNSGINASVWFTFIAPTSGTVQVTTDIAGATLTDTEMAVYSAASGFDPCAPDFTALTQVGCDQDGGTVVNFNSIVNASGLTAGDTYYVQVDRWGTASDGSFCIEVYESGCTDPAALNYSPTAVIDNGFCQYPGTDCSTAFALNVGCGTNTFVSGSTATSSSLSQTSCDSSTPGNFGNNDTWFTFTAPASGDIQVNVPVGSNVKGAVYDVCGGTELFCSTSIDGGVVSNLTPGNVYQLQLFQDYFNAADYEFCIEEVIAGCTDPTALNFDPTALVDDGGCLFPGANCSIAIPLALDCSTPTFVDMGNVTGSTVYDASCDAVGTNYNTWFEFTAPASGAIQVNLTLGSAEGAIFDACGGTEIYCTSGNINGVQITTGLTPGATYNLLMWKDFNSSDFEFCVEELTYGCLNPLGDNYDADADFDDGSCTFNSLCTGLDIPVIINMTDAANNGWEGATYEIVDEFGTQILSGDLDNALVGDGTSIGQDVLCLPDNAGYAMTLTQGGTPADIGWELIYPDGTVINSGGAPTSVCFVLGTGACPAEGCTNPLANNFDPIAVIDNGSCAFTVPVNNDCSSTLSIPVGSGVCNYFPANTTAATPNTDGMNPGCAPTGANDVFFDFVAPSTGEVIIDVNSTSGGTPYVAIYASCGSVAPICLANPQDILLAGFTPGVTYIVQILHDSTNPGGVEFCLYEPAPCSSNIFNLSATNITETSFDLSWLGGAAAEYTVEYGVYDAVAGTTPVASITTSDNPFSLTGLMSTTVYEVCVTGICDASATGQVCGLVSTLPGNDNVCGAAPLTVNATCSTQFTNIGATTEVGEVSGSCFSGGVSSSVWFTFVAPASGDVTVTTDIAGATLTDTEIAIYSVDPNSSLTSDLCVADFGSLTQVVCNQDGGSAIIYNSVAEAIGLTPGETYYVQVDRWSSANDGNFCIEVHDLGCYYGATATLGSCDNNNTGDEMDDTYTAIVDVTGYNGSDTVWVDAIAADGSVMATQVVPMGISGTVNVTGDGALAHTLNSYAGVATFVIPAEGDVYFNVYSADTTCLPALSNTISPTGPCSCTVMDVLATATTCDNNGTSDMPNTSLDDTYSVEVSVSASDAPSGNILINGEAFAYVDSATHVYTITVPADGSMPVIDVVFEDVSDCGGVSVPVTAPDGGGLSACSNDFCTATVDTPAAAMEELCANGNGLYMIDLASITANIVLSDVTAFGPVSWYTDAAYSNIFSGSILTHSGDACAVETVTLYAAAPCVADGLLQDAGMVTYTLYPNYDENNVVIVGADCEGLGSITVPDCYDLSGDIGMGVSNGNGTMTYPSITQPEPKDLGEDEVTIVFNTGSSCAISDNVAIPYFCPADCEILVGLGFQSLCYSDGTVDTTFFNQEVVINYTSAPNATDTIVVEYTDSEGMLQALEIQTTNPGPNTFVTIADTITGLIADGSISTISAYFKSDPACSGSSNSLQAPENCWGSCAFGVNTSDAINFAPFPGLDYEIVNVLVDTSNFVNANGPAGATSVTGPYTYNWDAEGYFQFNIIGNGNADIIADAGTAWTVTITDANGCTGVAANVATPGDAGNAEPVQIIVESVMPASSCGGTNDGAIDITLQGGSGSFNITWFGAVDTALTSSEDITGLIGNNWYVIDVIDLVEGGIVTQWVWVPCTNNGGGTRGKTEATLGLNAMPNPFSNTANVQFISNETTNLTVSVFNVDGREVAQLFRGETEANVVNTVSFNRENLPSGMYIIRMTTAEGQVAHHKINIAE